MLCCSAYTSSSFLRGLPLASTQPASWGTGTGGARCPPWTPAEQPRASAWQSAPSGSQKRGTKALTWPGVNQESIWDPYFQFPALPSLLFQPRWLRESHQRGLAGAGAHQTHTEAVQVLGSLRWAALRLSGHDHAPGSSLRRSSSTSPDQLPSHPCRNISGSPHPPTLSLSHSPNSPTRRDGSLCIPCTRLPTSLCPHPLGQQQTWVWQKGSRDARNGAEDAPVSLLPDRSGEEQPYKPAGEGNAAGAKQGSGFGRPELSWDWDQVSPFQGGSHPAQALFFSKGSKITRSALPTGAPEQMDLKK